jgi:hypothetical protein
MSRRCSFCRWFLVAVIVLCSLSLLELRLYVESAVALR